MLCEFTIQTLTPSLNTWQRTNRFAKTRIREVFAWECRAMRPRSWAPPPSFVRVLITRCGKRLIDADNLYGCKPLIDGLKDAGFILDDAPNRIDLRVAQEVTKSQPHMRIRLETKEIPC